MTSPLTNFLIKLLATDTARLAKADPDKLAQKYRISPEHARGYINLRKG